MCKSKEVALPSTATSELRTRLKALLSKYKGVDIINTNSKNVAQIAKAGIEKISSNKAVAKSVANGFLASEHFELAMQLPALFGTSFLKSVENDTKNNTNDLKVERYVSKHITLKSGKQAYALITVKWTLTTNIRRIYSIEAMASTK